MEYIFDKARPEFVIASAFDLTDVEIQRRVIPATEDPIELVRFLGSFLVVTAQKYDVVFNHHKESPIDKRLHLFAHTLINNLDVIDSNRVIRMFGFRETHSSQFDKFVQANAGSPDKLIMVLTDSSNQTNATDKESRFVSRFKQYLFGNLMDQYEFTVSHCRKMCYMAGLLYAAVRVPFQVTLGEIKRYFLFLMTNTENIDNRCHTELSRNYVRTWISNSQDRIIRVSNVPEEPRQVIIRETKPTMVDAEASANMMIEMKPPLAEQEETIESVTSFIDSTPYPNKQIANFMNSLSSYVCSSCRCLLCSYYFKLYQGLRWISSEKLTLDHMSQQDLNKTGRSVRVILSPLNEFFDRHNQHMLALAEERKVDPEFNLGECRYCSCGSCSKIPVVSRTQPQDPYMVVEEPQEDPSGEHHPANQLALVKKEDRVMLFY